MIYFVTGNAGKLEEAQKILGDLVQKNIGYTEIQADLLEEVVAFGLDELVRRLDPPFIIEDAGLFIEGLGGFPGVYSAYVFKTIGNEGILRLMADVDYRRAAFKSVVGYAEAQNQYKLFKGEVSGRITREPRGSGGFGYDPIFEVDGATIAEMTLDEKNRISHRGKSFRALLAWLEGKR